MILLANANLSVDPKALYPIYGAIRIPGTGAGAEVQTVYRVPRHTVQVQVQTSAGPQWVNMPLRLEELDALDPEAVALAISFEQAEVKGEMVDWEAPHRRRTPFALIDGKPYIKTSIVHLGIHEGALWQIKSVRELTEHHTLALPECLAVFRAARHAGACLGDARWNIDVATQQAQELAGGGKRVLSPVRICEEVAEFMALHDMPRLSSKVIAQLLNVDQTALEAAVREDSDFETKELVFDSEVGDVVSTRWGDDYAEFDPADVFLSIQRS